MVYNYTLYTLSRHDQYFGICDREPINIVDIPRPYFEQPWKLGWPRSVRKPSPKGGYLRLHDISFIAVDIVRKKWIIHYSSQPVGGRFQVYNTTLFDKSTGRPINNIQVVPELTSSYIYRRGNPNRSYSARRYWRNCIDNIACKARNPALGLLLTSRQVHRETNEMIDRIRAKRPLAFAEYGPNNWAMLWRYLHNLSPADRSQVQNILIHNRTPLKLTKHQDDRLSGGGRGCGALSTRILTFTLPSIPQPLSAEVAWKRCYLESVSACACSDVRAQRFSSRSKTCAGGILAWTRMQRR